MKKRALVAALCCLSTASTTAVAAPVATAQTATANKTMADQYEVEFGTIPQPFKSVYGIETSTRLRYSGLPSGTKLTILGPNGGDTDTENGLYVAIQNDRELWLQIFPRSLPRAASTSNTVKFLVVYPDGSTEVVDHTFTVYPLQKLIYSPRIDAPMVQEGVDTNLTIEDLPKGAQVQIVDAPVGWKTSIRGNVLTVNASQTGSGSVVTYITFADGSNLPVTFEITAEPKSTTSKETEKPQLPGESTETDAADDKQSNPAISGGSSTAGTIAGVIGAVLAIALSIGGAAFAGLIPGLKLPF